MRQDTRKILWTGIVIFVLGVASALVTIFVLGGIGPQGPHTNMGWLFLMLAMGCLPTGLLTLLLAAAKINTDRKRVD